MSDTVFVVNESVPGVAVVTAASGPIVGPQGATGATGPQGPRGLSILSGTGAPSSGLGVNGEYYIDTASNLLYGPKTANAWGTGKSLVGPQGPAGSQGPAGPQGVQGPMGTVAAIPFAGSGTATTAARSDHTHAAAGTQSAGLVAGSSNVTGGTRPAGTALIQQVGTWVGNVANDTGGVAITFPSAFPTGVVTVMSQPGDNTNDIGYIVVDVNAVYKTSFANICVKRNGGYVAKGALIRINWMAVGW